MSGTSGVGNKPTGTGYTENWANRTDANVFENLDTEALLADYRAAEAQGATQSGAAAPTQGGHFERSYFDRLFTGDGMTMLQEAEREEEALRRERGGTTTAASMTLGNVQG